MANVSCWALSWPATESLKMVTFGGSSRKPDFQPIISYHFHVAGPTDGFDPSTSLQGVPLKFSLEPSPSSQQQPTSTSMVQAAKDGTHAIRNARGQD